MERKVGGAHLNDRYVECLLLLSFVEQPCW